jgi:hypothetical protein
MSKNTTLATFKLDPAVWEEFRLWAIGKGSNATEVFRFLVGECLAGRIDVPVGQHRPQAVMSVDQKIEEAIAPLRVELAELRRLVESMNSAPTSTRRRSADGSISDATARVRAAAMGWRKGGESVETFLGRQGWTRSGHGNKAKWFPPPQG